MSRGAPSGLAEGRDAAGMLRGVPEPLRPLLPELYAALRESLATARLTLDRGDGEGARLAAHGLKGAAMRFGLEALAREAGRAEEHAERKDLGAAAKSLRRFLAVLASLEKA